MANEQVNYIIRLKDMMSSRLKKMGVSVKTLTRQLRRGLAGALKLVGGLMRGLKTAALVGGAAMAGITYAAVRMGKAFLDAASTLEDTQIKFAAVFKGVEDQAMEMVENISEGLKFGQGSVMGFMATIQDTLVPMGFARDEAATFSAGLTSLAADLTTFNPKIRDTGQAIGMLQSVLVGMHRPALQFGVVINEDKIAAEALAMGLGDVNGELTDQEKVMVRLSLILKGTTDAQGALLRGSETFTVQTLQLNEAITDLREEMGMGLRAALNDAILRLGGVDGVLLIVETGFRGVTTFLVDYVIPAVTKVAENFVKFITAAGGADEAANIMAKGMRLAFKVVLVAVKSAYGMVLLFIQGLDAIQAIVKLVGGALVVLASGLAEGLVGAFYLGVKVVALFLEGLDSVVIFIKDIAVAAFQGLVNMIADLVESIGEALIALGEFDLMPDFLADAGAAATKAAAGMRDFSGGLDELKGGETIIKDLADSIDSFAEDSIMPTLEMVHNFTVAMAELTVDEFADDMERLGERGETINALFREIQTTTVETVADYEALRDRVAEVVASMEGMEIVGPDEADRAALMEEQLARLAAMMDLFAQKAREAKEGVDGVGASMGAVPTEGLAGGIAQVEKQIGTFGEQMAGVTAGAINAFASGLTNAFVSILDGSKSAGEAFRQFASQFLIQVGSMIIQALILRAVTGGLGMIGFATGGIAQGGLTEVTPLANGGLVGGGLGRMLPVKGYATGGPIVDKPHIALIGEGKHNEAVVPLPDGKSIPVDMQGASGANVTVDISAVDAKSVDRLLMERRETLTDIIRNAVQQSRSFRGAIGNA